MPMNNQAIYEGVTAKVIQSLEEGKVPWQRPWREMVSPRNLISKKPYRGINFFTLALSEHTSPFWATFNQIKFAGGKVKKGEKGEMIVFWKPIEVDDRDNPGQMKRIPFIRYSRVFNLDQTEGIDPTKVPTFESNEDDPIEHCEQIVAEMPNAPSITHGGSSACYYPKLDTVNVPAFEQFVNAEAYYATVFHELAHSTGHETRLKRPGVMEFDKFGSERYTREELVAEMASAMVCAVAQIDKPVFDNTKAYIRNWIAKLNEDPRLLVTAAGQAQKAADFILGQTPESEAHTE